MTTSNARYAVETAIIGGLARSGIRFRDTDALREAVARVIEELFCPLQIETTADFIQEIRHEREKGG